MNAEDSYRGVLLPPTGARVDPTRRGHRRKYVGIQRLNVGDVFMVRRGEHLTLFYLCLVVDRKLWLTSAGIMLFMPY